MLRQIEPDQAPRKRAFAVGPFRPPAFGRPRRFHDPLHEGALVDPEQARAFRERQHRQLEVRIVRLSAHFPLLKIPLDIFPHWELGFVTVTNPNSQWGKMSSGIFRSGKWGERRTILTSR